MLLFLPFLLLFLHLFFYTSPHLTLCSSFLLPHPFFLAASLSMTSFVCSWLSFFLFFPLLVSHSSLSSSPVMPASPFRVFSTLPSSLCHYLHFIYYSLLLFSLRLPFSFFSLLPSLPHRVFLWFFSPSHHQISFFGLPVSIKQHEMSA